ncbi:T9SS type A sorting domain-containing protein [Cellulophaga baltica]|uniref:T9SS type A sorting domain-containing protein n=1 Tax=Cellulophaga TaxID=104264 RepID=UPI001C06BC7C|nr:MULTISPECIES: T9SS type A sorting domain-containing protein [Cellulophaga]MBU2995543.1 T9SS type A sorting domain-containing protein [Cellulophaga baltica]MDO6766937.1 T9SS type A sorting domain-containing protein [Cellulophaga sp. 1_MG-2023]
MKKFYFILLTVITISFLGNENLNSQTNDKEIEKFNNFSNTEFYDLAAVASHDNIAKDILVFDLFGEVALQEHTTYNKLNVSNLDTGIYIIQVTENTKTTSRKLVVK